MRICKSKALGFTTCVKRFNFGLFLHNNPNENKLYLDEKVKSEIKYDKKYIY